MFLTFTKIENLERSQFPRAVKLSTPIFYNPPFRPSSTQQPFDISRYFTPTFFKRTMEAEMPKHPNRNARRECQIKRSALPKHILVNLKEPSKTKFFQKTI